MAKSGRIQKFFKSFSVKQLIWFILGCILWLAGLTFLVLNIVGTNLDMAPSNNPLLSADTSIKGFLNAGLGFLYWGIIMFILGAVIVAISLSLSSSLEDRERDKQARRELRLKRMMQNQGSEETKAEVKE